MLAVRYDRFAGIDGIYLADIPEPTPGPDEVLVQVEAAALNPGSLAALNGAAFTPNRDLAGTVIAVGSKAGGPNAGGSNAGGSNAGGSNAVGSNAGGSSAGRSDVGRASAAGSTDAGSTGAGFAAGDQVLGWVQSWDAHAPRVTVPTSQLVPKPDTLSWDLAGSLYTTPMAGVGAWKAIDVGPGDLVVIAGASGGVGLVAAQYAVRAGSRVIGLASRRHFGGLRQLGIEPVPYGDQEEHRIRTAAGDQPVTGFIDAVGGHYIDLAFALGVAPEHIDTVVDYAAAQEKGVKALGTRDAGGLAALSELAKLVSAGGVRIPIGATYPLSDVREAYRALRDRRIHGRILLHPQVSKAGG